LIAKRRVETLLERWLSKQNSFGKRPPPVQWPGETERLSLAVYRQGRGWLIDQPAYEEVEHSNSDA
jgi:hypothetical protein